ncbi:MAG: type I-MYXAN CRISPR-associated protein Cas6/Cmx6 [Gallionella sp.]|nr:type I-MYXAN CRISPR-associated protein Cas6/Cmx6 [Gallionella sp.]
MSDISDLVFDLSGDSLPADYPFALWAALVRQVPSLAQDEQVGVLPLRGSENNARLLLNRRSKLVLRVPASLAEAASTLAGSHLEIADTRIGLGSVKRRAILPHPTLHAQLAAGAEDESEFLMAVQQHFAATGITANTLCGIRRTLTDGTASISGFSLVVHDLKPEASVLLQSTGLGEGRCYGCGIFTPYKVITDLE